MVRIEADFLKGIEGLKKIVGKVDNEFSGFAYDSRLVKGGELFFAFKTEKNDGNNFVASALKRGAKGYIGQIENIDLNENQTAIIVKDTFEFLYKIAKKILDKSSARVIALTGSAGKTTTKEFLASLFNHYYKIYKTPKNFNSDIGVPLGVLEAFEKDTEVAIFELGANRFGEIEKNSLLIRPDVAVILNVLRSHLEKLGSVEGVVKAKKEIFSGLKENGKILLNYDNEYTRKIGKDFNNLTYFGFSEKADFKFIVLKRNLLNGSLIKFESNGESEVFKVNLFLKTHIENFAAAVSLAKAAGLELSKIKEVCSSLKPYTHRGRIIRKDEALILDDSYNSNPDALKLVINDFSTLKGKKVVVIGEILELGEKSPMIHKELAEFFRSIKGEIDKIYFIKGDMIYPYEILKNDDFWKEKVFFYDSYKEFRERFFSILKERVSVLIKGSHGTNLYKLVEEVENEVKE